MSQNPIIDPKQTIIVITVEGKDYPLDCSEFTAREVGVLKRIGHLRGPSDMAEALKAVDLEAVAALAIIAMQRAGKNVNPEALLDAKLGEIKISLPEAEADPTPAS